MIKIFFGYLCPEQAQIRCTVDQSIFRANLPVIPIYHDLLCIAGQSESLQAKFFLDETQLEDVFHDCI